MTGRPSDYTQELADDICAWVANGRSLLSYCEQEGAPHFATIYRWQEKHADFRDAFARARESQAHADADRLNLLSEQLAARLVSSDVARVMADILKWTASRRAPKSYGDKLQVGGEDGAPLVVTWAGGEKV